MERFSSSSQASSSTHSKSTCNLYPAKPPDQARLSFTESQQSLPNYEQQTTLTIDSTEEYSTDDDSIYDRDTSSTNKLVVPSLYEQRGKQNFLQFYQTDTYSFYHTKSFADSPKPDLNCILFNDSICSITCNQVCLLYNFESTGICTEHKTCYCTIVGMKSPAMSLNQYESQSLDDLWYYKFVKSSVSAKILNQIKKYPTMSSKVQEMLRKPLRTGDDVKNRLSTAYPEWTTLHNLKSRRRAPINRFIDVNYELDESGLEKRIKRMAKKYRNDIVKQFSSTDYLITLTRFLDSIDDEIQLRHIFKQIHETKVESLIEYTKNYLQQRDLDFSTEDLESTECDCVDVDYIDNIVAGALINRFLSMISTAIKSSNSASNNTDKLSNTDAIQISTTNTQDSLYTTSDIQHVNSNQCSCSSKTTTEDLDDDSRWKMPGFDEIMLKDYCGSVEEVWQTADYYLSYEKWSTGSIKLEWRKGHDSVHIDVYSTGSIDQEWRFDDAIISLSVASTGSITQSWQMGDFSYTFSKWSTGSIERKWKNNYSNQNLLAKYQGYISSWCAKNYFLIENWHCVIY